MDGTGAKPPRAVALDALRGGAVLMMALAAYIPWGVLPRWMYHAQTPPPQHIFRPDLPGLTWVDLVFPFFLFAMGAAIPLSLSSRLKRQQPIWRILLSIAERAALLAAFAVYIQHIRPGEVSANPGAREYWMGMLGFALLLPVLLRLPETIPGWARACIRAAGAAGAVLVAMAARFPDGSGPGTAHNDIIIVLLANASFFGSLVWLCTRRSILGRMSVLGFLMAFRLSAGVPMGWLHGILSASPFPWLYQSGYSQYLFLVLPGTVAGDLLVAWRDADRKTEGTSRRFTTALPPVAVCAIGAMLVLLQTRHVGAAVVAAALVCGAAIWATRRPRVPSEELLAGLARWGTYLLLLGLAFEPYEGGIKKDDATMSYYFVSGGLAFLALAGLAVISDVGRRRARLGALVACGQNPILAYAATSTLVPAIWQLTGVGALLTRVLPGPWPGVLVGAIEVALLALVTWVFTARKLFLRA